MNLNGNGKRYMIKLYEKTRWNNALKKSIGLPLKKKELRMKMLGRKRLLFLTTSVL